MWWRMTLQHPRSSISKPSRRYRSSVSYRLAFVWAPRNCKDVCENTVKLFNCMSPKFRGLKTFNMWTLEIIDLKLYAILLKWIVLYNSEVFCWDLKFVDFLTHEIHKSKCATNMNDFTVRGTKLNYSFTASYYSWENILFEMELNTSKGKNTKYKSFVNVVGIYNITLDKNWKLESKFILHISHKIIQKKLYYCTVSETPFFIHTVYTTSNLNFIYKNKRAQRALGRSPEEKVKGQGENIYSGPLMLSTKYW